MATSSNLDSVENGLLYGYCPDICPLWFLIVDEEQYLHIFHIVTVEWVCL